MGRRKEFRGIVISDKMEKTIVVRVTRLAKHPKYRRIMKQCNKYKVHDESRQAKVGDEVRILETRPLSKDKRYRLVEITKKADVIQSELKE
ncbi:MAG: 30S ribosomal protein S17 [Candidatus Omnitrophota bacterium]